MDGESHVLQKRVSASSTTYDWCTHLQVTRAVKVELAVHPWTVLNLHHHMGHRGRVHRRTSSNGWISSSTRASCAHDGKIAIGHTPTIISPLLALPLQQSNPTALTCTLCTYTGRRYIQHGRISQAGRRLYLDVCLLPSKYTKHD